MQIHKLQAKIIQNSQILSVNYLELIKELF